jgi:hypothetical protein
MEMKRIYLLADLIVQNAISDSFQPEWRPDLKAIWPSARIDQEDAVDKALDARGYQRVLLAAQSTKLATWSMEEQRWYCCAIAETADAALAESDPLSGRQIVNLILAY